MGLDLVEMVMEIEEAFDVSIPDDEASEIRTVGELFDCAIGKRMEGKAEGVCLTSAAFYRVRRVLTSTLNLSRRDIRPDTELDPLIPEKNRRVLWQEMQEAAELKFPKLVHPPWIAKPLGVLVALPVLALLWLVCQGPAWPVMLIVGSIPAFLLWSSLLVITLRMTDCWATKLDKDCATVGGLARGVLAKNYVRIADETNAWNPDEAWKIYVAIIVEQLGVDESQVTRDASFVDDLGGG